MKVQEAIKLIHAPKGVTSILSGLMTGDYSTLPHAQGLGADLEKARAKVLQTQKAFDACQSDWAYWSILGDLAYWKAIENILTAGAANNGEVADVPAPQMEGLVVMVAIGRVEEFGKKVLDETRKLIASRGQTDSGTMEFKKPFATAQVEGETHEYLEPVEHTPGPWSVDSDLAKSDRVVTGSNGNVVCLVVGETSGIDVERDANANLIHAAPGLLKALERSVQEMEYLLQELQEERPGSYRASTTIRDAQSAINKARGKY